jgi:hypothetical protein
MKTYIYNHRTEEYLCWDGWREESAIDNNYPPFSFEDRVSALDYMRENGMISGDISFDKDSDFTTVEREFQHER